MDRAALTPDEAAEVLRRAAEIQTAGDVRRNGLDPSAVVAMGSSLGLSEEAVRTALSERRSPPPVPSVASRPLLGLDADVRVERSVASSPGRVQDELGAWLRREWLHRYRCEPGRTTWRARRGTVADLRRSLDLLGTLQLKGVSAVEVRADQEGDGARVAVTLSLTVTRAEALATMVALPAGLVGGGGVLAAALAGPEALLALPLAGAAGGLGWLAARASVAARRRSVAEAVDGVLDQLHGR